MFYILSLHIIILIWPFIKVFQQKKLLLSFVSIKLRLRRLRFSCHKSLWCLVNFMSNQKWSVNSAFLLESKPKPKLSQTRMKFFIVMILIFIDSQSEIFCGQKLYLFLLYRTLLSWSLPGRLLDPKCITSSLKGEKCAGTESAENSKWTDSTTKI